MRRAVHASAAVALALVGGLGDERARSDEPTPAPTRPAEPLPAPVQHLLDSGAWDRGTPKGFRIIALSHIADACAVRPAAAETRACVARAVELSERTRPKGKGPVGGLWRTHRALILADALELRAGPPDVEAELRAMAAQLAGETLAERHAIVASYASNEARWPADQAATLAALARADRLLGTHLVDEPLVRYRALYVRGDALPVSEATGAFATSPLARGCALSWSIRYLAEVDPALARDWWAAYRASHGVDALLVAGFREWPPGVDRPADRDSGPIVQGVGAAATALGIAAARSVGDEPWAERLEGTAALAGGLGLGRGVSETVLAAAIRDLGRHPPVVLRAPEDAR